MSIKAGPFHFRNFTNFFNPDISEAHTLRGWYDSHGGNVETSLNVSSQANTTIIIILIITEMIVNSFLKSRMNPSDNMINLIISVQLPVFHLSVPIMETFHTWPVPLKVVTRRSLKKGPISTAVKSVKSI